MSLRRPELRLIASVDLHAEAQRGSRGSLERGLRDREECTSITQSAALQDQRRSPLAIFFACSRRARTLARPSAGASSSRTSQTICSYGDVISDRHSVRTDHVSSRLVPRQMLREVIDVGRGAFLEGRVAALARDRRTGGRVVEVDLDPHDDDAPQAMIRIVDVAGDGVVQTIEPSLTIGRHPHHRHQTREAAPRRARRKQALLLAHR